jgi:hypothetical protein
LADNIKDLTKLMMFSGRLSSVHVENLKSFPFIFFNGVTEVKIDHDISTTKDKPSIVSYDLKLDTENDFLDKRYQALESAIRGLFWKEVRLQVSINNKEVYKSE